MIDNNFKH